jgi:methylphosphotriester-DNA--protein-cysteine methyltransferase
VIHNKPLSGRSITTVRQAIASAQEYAEQHNVPLTAERLAAALHMDLKIFRSIVDGSYTEEGGKEKENREKISAIRNAFSEATASVMEHAMMRGSSANMHILYLKENAGYGENAGMPTETTAPVIFLGEQEISD